LWRNADLQVMRANSRYEEIKETFRNNEIERDDLSSRIGKLDEKVRVTKQNVEIMVSERMERMKEQLDTTTKVLTLQVEKSAKDLERLKFDLNEMVE
jgi:dynactin complex subunit